MAKFRTLFLCLLPLQLLLVHWAGDKPQLVEHFYSRGFYPLFSKMLRLVTGWLPLPIGQILVAVFLLYVSWWIIKEVRRRRRVRELGLRFLWILIRNGLAIFSFIYFYFLLSWGFNYQRQPLLSQWGLQTDSITVGELKRLNEGLIVNCNALRQEIGLENKELPITESQILSSAYEGYDQMDTLAVQYKSIKSAILPQTFSTIGIAGIYSMITGEANVNLHPPNYLLPFTACHEIAHQLGYAPEDEANFIGFLATQNHPDISFQYSGNLAALRYSMRSLYWADSNAYHHLAEMIREPVKQDLKSNSEYWDSYDNPLDVLSNIIYDYYLKANSQSAGIRSYGMVTRLLVGYARRKQITNASE